MKTLVIMGRLGHSPRLKQLDSGDHMLTIQVAVNEPVQVGAEWKEETTWIDVIMWGRRAKYLGARLVKGEAVTCSGEMYVRHYQGRDGRDRTRVELRANKIDQCGARPDREHREGADHAGAAQDDHGEPV